MSEVQHGQVSSPYQSLAQRIQRVITSPAAQSARSAYLYRAPEESEHLWDVLIDELGEAESVRTQALECGGVRVTWDPPSAD
ncbi:DUF1654 domain-containing protein [Pseudomonas viridiflava]|uniref:DUF1654 domain-containing protein n=1 Tax=Pseudomonas viridiflava TaxID=33069 RepID=UPI001C31A0AF|nr:DUF1654 domain-containing protein [Pseudomonas viridiflava]QXG34012.1 DUF1654 domain-containing protein [Pseudomonas viridiflava]QXG42233.1 DUF1654 domain-containing protein [Pseudomonas viridiflava]